MATAPERPPLSTAGEKDPFAGWDDVPLFMKSLPAEQGGRSKPAAGDENYSIDALQALMYDGPPSEIAADLKAQGNTLFAARKFRDAIGFYTRALDEVGNELPVEERRVLWSNRAAGNLELGNFGATLRDISLVMSAPATYYPNPTPESWNRTTMKALLRSARALSGLEKLPEAVDALKRLRILEVELGEEAKDVGLKVRTEVEAKIAKKERKEAETKEKVRRATAGDKAIREALELRGVKLPKGTSKALFASCPIDITPPHFDPSELPPSSLLSHPLLPPSSPSPTSPWTPWTAPLPQTSLIFPVFLLLPLASPPTRDLCLSFHTSSTFGEVLLSMEHDPAALQLYLATASGRVLKVGAKLPLATVLEAASKGGEDGWELKEGWALEMVGVPKGPEGEKWVQGWKEEVKGAAALLGWSSRNESEEDSESPPAKPHASRTSLHRPYLDWDAEDSDDELGKAESKKDPPAPTKLRGMREARPEEAGPSASVTITKVYDGKKKEMEDLEDFE